MIVDSVNLSLKNEFTLWTSGKYEVFDISRFRYTQMYLWTCSLLYCGWSQSLSQQNIFFCNKTSNGQGCRRGM